MSRELKRVPLDFDYPLNVLWEGYVMPDDCRASYCYRCDGTGYNAKTKELYNTFFDYEYTGNKWCDKLTQDEVAALVEKDMLWVFTRLPISEEQKQECKSKGKEWLDYNNGVMPLAEEVNKAQTEYHSMFSYSHINRLVLVEVRAKRLGVWGKCRRCKGEGYYYKDKATEQRNKEWERIDPPTGEGYQLWNNCSVGKPLSPVFTTLDDLCAWAEHNATTFAYIKTSKENWKEMLSNDCVGHTEGNAIFM